MNGGTERVGDVRLLGPVVVLGPDGPVPTTSVKVRTLLALLASPPGVVVSADRLIDQLWGDDPPENPRKALQVQVSRLRTWLVGADGDHPPTVVHAAGGYRLDVVADRVDLVRFVRAAEAAEAASSPAEVLGHCDAALAEWRGEPFLGVPEGQDVLVEKVHQRELHLGTVERRAEALLALGRHEEAIVGLHAPRLQDLAHERFTELLMVALVRSGRQQEALAAYEETRRFLVEEHGIVPGDALAATERAVLTQDPTLLASPVPVPARSPLPPRPVIVGRDVDLATLAALRTTGGAGAIVVVSGEAGAGKTTLVQAAAHDAADAGARVGIGAFDDPAPLSAWRRALAAVGANPDDLADDQRDRAVWAALAQAGRSRGALVVLEDAHDADTTSLGLLQALVRRGLPPGVVVAVTARSPDTIEHEAWARTEADVARSPATTVVTLGPLGRADADRLVGGRLTALGAGSVAAVAAELWDRTTGHPLHLVSLLDLMGDDATEADCLATARRVPASLRPLLDHQLATLPDPCRDLVEGLAVTGPVTVDAVAGLLDLEPLAALRALRPALARHLVVDDGGLLRLRHSLWATAVADSMGTAVAEELHRRRLGAVAAGAGDPFATLRHAVGAGRRIAPRERGRHRAAAGRAAFARGAHAEAADLLSDAVLEVDDDTDVDLLLHHGLALAACGRSAEADEALDTVVFRSEATVAQVVTAAVGHEMLGFRVTGDARRLARLDEALVVSKGADAPVRIEVLRALLIEESLVLDRPTSVAAREELADLVAAVGPTLSPALQARLRAMEARDVVEHPVAAGVRLARARLAHEAAVTADQPGLVLDSLELLVSASLAAGLPEDEVEDVRWVLAQTAEVANRPRSRWAASLLPAALALARGDGEEAEALAVAAFGRGAEMGIPDAGGAYGVHLVTARFLDGALGELVELIDGLVAQYPTISAWPAAAALARAQLGDGAGAREQLALFLERRAAQGSLYFDRPGLAMAAAAAHLAGDHPTCRQVATVVVDALPHDPDAVVVVGVGAAAFGPVDLYVALARATLGDTDAARAHAATARALMARLGWRPWLQAVDALLARLEATSEDRTPPPVPGPPATSPLGWRPLP